MRLPIKLNEAGWPARFSRLSFAFHDPRPLAGNGAGLSQQAFSDAISTMQFGVTFKTTRPGRQQHSNRFVRDLLRGSKPAILDVGASDGSTSLDLIRTLDGDFRRYYVTDLNLSARCGLDRGGIHYFLDNDGNCVLRASKRFIVYSEVNGAILPLRVLAQALISGHRRASQWREVVLIQPELIGLARSDPRVSIMRYDMFTPWKGEIPGLIKIANLLNGKYFSPAQMSQALRVQCSNLAENGFLLLVSEDDEVEKFSVFRKSRGAMQLEHTHAGGAKAAHLVPSQIDLPDVNAA